MEDLDRPTQKEDIADLRREEASRGKRGPVAFAARRRRVELERRFRKLLERGTEADFHAAMRAVGVPSNSSQFHAALAIWRENRLL